MPAKKPTRILFIDTEFTSLGEPWPVELISVGMCDAHGDKIFYAENDDYDPRLCSEFTRERVEPLLQRGDALLHYADLCENFFLAIESCGHDCALAADSTWDWLWVQMMAQGEKNAIGPKVLDDPRHYTRWPANLSPSLAHVNYHALSSIDKKASCAASNAYFRSRYPHHALGDAIGNALRAKAAIEANPGLSCEQPEHLCKVFKLSMEALSWDGALIKKQPLPRI